MGFLNREIVALLVFDGETILRDFGVLQHDSLAGAYGLREPVCASEWFFWSLGVTVSLLFLVNSLKSLLRNLGCFFKKNPLKVNFTVGLVSNSPNFQGSSRMLEL